MALVPLAKPEDARAAYAGEAAPDARLSAVMRAAAGMVRRLAPFPDDAPTETLDDYNTLGAEAELLAGAWFWETGGYVTRESVMDASKQYGAAGDLEDAIRALMADYVEDEPGSGAPGNVTLRDAPILAPNAGAGGASLGWLPFNVNDPSEAGDAP